MTVSISFGQITTTKVVSKVEQVDNSPYDSIENFLALYPNKYIGQEFYLKGKSESLRQYGYEGFTLDYNKSTLDNKKNVYKSFDGYNSKYADLAGKYFKVLEVIKHPKAATGDSTDEYLYGDKWFIKLQEKVSGDIVYFEYKGGSKYFFPFIVVGFFEKQKKVLFGQEFVLTDRILKVSSGSGLDIITGKPLTITTGEKWKCTDFTIEEKYFNLALVIVNSIGEKAAVSYDAIFDERKFAYTLLQANNYIKKFGAETFDKILQGKIIIGMTKEMCTLSWGEPKNINETITAGKKTEQWVYSDNYLYFDNGVVTAMQ